jgi:hypothetical protein
MACRITSGRKRWRRRERDLPRAVHRLHDPQCLDIHRKQRATYDWEADQWSVPVNFMVAKLTPPLSQPGVHRLPSFSRFAWSTFGPPNSFARRDSRLRYPDGLHRRAGRLALCHQMWQVCHVARKTIPSS